MLSLSGYLIYSTGPQFLLETSGGFQIAMFLFYLIFPGTLILLAIKWKLVFINNNHLTLVYPFRLKKRRIDLLNIKSLRWKMWGNYRTGDYQVLELVTKNSERISISDFEFQNFMTLENSILESIKFKPNLKTRNDNRYEQARTNISLSIIVAVFTTLTLVTTYSKATKSNFEVSPPTLIFFISILVLLRLAFQLFDYAKRLRNKT